MADVPQVQVGDQVTFCREDYVGRVDEYDAYVMAVHEDGSLDLNVAYINGTRINSLNTRYDPEGKPSSWHVKQLS